MEGLSWMVEEFTLHNRIGFKVTSLARVMESRLERMLKKHNVTRLMWCVLRGVGMEDQTTPSQLASYIGVARPAISRLLKTMMDRGFIERQSKGEDGRVSEVVLTELGLSTMKECHILVRELNNHYSSKLDEETFEQFMQTINVLLEGEDETLMRL